MSFTISCDKSQNQFDIFGSRKKPFDGQKKLIFILWVVYRFFDEIAMIIETFVAYTMKPKKKRKKTIQTTNN